MPTRRGHGWGEQVGLALKESVRRDFARFWKHRNASRRNWERTRKALGVLKSLSHKKGKQDAHAEDRS